MSDISQRAQALGIVGGSSWPGSLQRYESPQVLVRAVAERIVAAASESIAARGRFSIALSGGSSPKKLYQLLASDEFAPRIDWSRVMILFGDDRAVRPDDERSNFRMAREAMLDAVPLGPSNVHRMRGEAENLEEAAKEYGLLIQSLEPLDVVLLGMGPDGHTASLFPHSPALQERKHRCVATPVASLEPFVPRLTLTYRVFDEARRVWILADGAGKASRLRQVLAGPMQPDEQPIQGLRPRGELTWFLDNASASEL